MKLIVMLLAVVATTTTTPTSRGPRQSSSADFQTEPRRAVVRPDETITLLGNAGGPIRKCHFYLPRPGGKFLDFSQGPDSPSTDRYEYFGQGLENGDCGIRFKRVEEDDDGIVECKVKLEATNKWEKCVTTLRVTEVDVNELPVFEIEPRTASLRTGDNLTVACNADRPINMCHIYLPGPRYLNFDRGPQSERTKEYRYFGTGLRNGQCGVTLTGVDSRLDGYVVCKLGQWPEQVTGAWVTDALKVATASRGNNTSDPSHGPTNPLPQPSTSDFQTEPRRAVVRPAQTITLLGKAGAPIRKCHFYLPGPNGKFLDFSQGPDSPFTDRYEYFGRGLDNGECGIRYKRVENKDDGIVECKVQLEGTNKWEKCVTTLRVTEVPVNELPIFEIEPRTANLRTGDNLTVICNADRPINMCHIYLPGPRYLNFDRGVQSDRTREYRYFGTGLKNGQCGVTLTGVDSRLNGYVVCKLGQWPEQVTGAWETDALKVATANAVPPSSGLNPTRPPQYTGSKPTSGGAYHISGPPRRPGYPLPRPSTPAPVTSNSSRSPEETSGEKCGRVKMSPAALITEGQATQQGQWPWHAALYRNKDNGLTYICGGTLISKTAVVTAGHCVIKKPSNRPVDPDTLVLYFGKYHRLLWSEGGVQNKHISRIILHPGFNSSNLQGDIAIIRLVSPVDYSDFVRPICLWDKTKTGLNEVVGKTGTIVGWGYDHTKSPTSELMMAKQPVVDQQTCIYSYQEFFSLYTNNRTLCAGTRNGTSACNGDSGGGLVFPIKRPDDSVVWHIRALVSLSVPTPTTRICDPSHYTVYTDIAQYLPWIEQSIR